MLGLVTMGGGTIGWADGVVCWTAHGGLGAVIGTASPLF